MAKLLIGINDLATLFPDVAAEWHPTKNGHAMARDFTARSGKRVWWQCSEGHEWQAIIASRSNGSGCPYCKGNKAILGETDLVTINPFLSSEWHPALNEELTPEQVTAGCGQKVWWQCSEGHAWQSTIYHRNKGNGCPYCSGRLPILGKTDLATLFPDIAAEWHPTKNGQAKPSEFTANSGKRVWWQCSKGHEWLTVIYTRTYKKSGCPYCSGRLPLVGVNDLKTINPSLASDWHLSLNGNLSPEQVTAGSSKKVWWQCSEGHVWLAYIYHRNKGDGCPYCSGKMAIKGETDLLTLFPEIAAEWHPTKNGNLCPEQVMPGSGKKVWWKCSEGHEWQAVIKDRTRGSGCPYCSGKMAIKGETDLLTLFPEIAVEWHPTKNGNLCPEQVMPGSRKKVWWLCKCGHEWRATVDNRTHGRGCPSCALFR